MCKLLFICAILLISETNTNPPHIAPNQVLTSNFEVPTQQNLQSILHSIEERLRNFENVYTMQLQPTLEAKVEQYHRKLEAIDTKLIHFENTVTLKLDQILENSNIKNYRDDITKTNILKNIEGIFGSITHGFNYINGRIELNANKVHNKLDGITSKLEKMEETLATRDENINSELTDVITAIDDLHGSYTITEENILNKTQQINENLDLHKNYFKHFNRTTQKIFNKFNELQKQIKNDNTTNYLNNIKRDLNEYANKVADMNTENWETNEILTRNQEQTLRILNASIEFQENFKVLYGKQPKNLDKNELAIFTKIMENNFEKVFSAQNLFMDSCYRLQMDESQIESKISLILEKLVETFDDKMTNEIQGVKNVEKLIKNHDAHVSRNIHQLGTEVLVKYNKLMKYSEELDGDVEKVVSQLDTLLLLMQNHHNKSEFEMNNFNALLNNLTIDEYKNQSIAINNLNKQMEKILDLLLSQAPSNELNNNIKDIYLLLSHMETKMNKTFINHDIGKKNNIDALLRHSPNQRSLKDFEKILDNMQKTQPYKSAFETIQAESIIDDFIIINNKREEEEENFETTTILEDEEEASRL